MDQKNSQPQSKEEMIEQFKKFVEEAPTMEVENVLLRLKADTCDIYRGLEYHGGIMNKLQEKMSVFASQIEIIEERLRNEESAEEELFEMPDGSVQKLN